VSVASVQTIRQGENVMATTTPDQNLDRRETAQLIGSDKVEGTPVYRSNGDHIGQIERIMIDKISGKVAYAVMSFGGFVGIGEDYYPLPWSLLTYNTRLEGYEVNVSEQSSTAPRNIPSTRAGIGPTVRAARKSTITTAPLYPRKAISILLGPRKFGFKFETDCFGNADCSALQGSKKIGFD
jgi:hypothetical protein